MVADLVEERTLLNFLLAALCWGFSFVFAEQNPSPLGDRQQASLVTLDLDDLAELLQVGTQALRDFPSGVILQDEAASCGSCAWACPAAYPPYHLRPSSRACPCAQ